ncbi:MAG: potassium transporter [Muribaculaceae bacterium]|nr:potassium transporter [Muribaculaceae bacterium]
MSGSVFKSLARRLKAARSRYGNFTYRFSHAINVGAGILYVASLISAVLCLVVLVVIGGYEHSAVDLARLTGLLHLFQGIFIVDILYNLILRLRATLRSGRVVMMIVDGAMLLTLIPLLYPRPENPWLPWLAGILYSRYFVYLVLTGYSIVEVSFGLMSVTRKRTNPSLLLSCSFLFFILAGSFVLMLPRFTVEPISYIDSLFVATSAVCITGLTPVDIAATFTPAGYIVLCVLFQVGALGVLTFTCFFAIFFSGATSVYNQLLVRDMIYSKTMNALVPTLLYIMTFTLAIEAAGAVAVYFTAPADLFAHSGDRIMFAIFHAMSSFCNVGFSCLPDGMSNPALMTASQSVYSVTSLLVIAGGIGFPILVNLKDIVVLKFRNLWHRLRHIPVERRVHVYDLNTKLVLATYFGILAFASVAFFFLEYDNTLRGMSLWQKVVQSVFNSLVPRSAGFSSVNPADFLPITLLLVVVQMWIGGGSQSLAGGIKVNTVAAVWLNMRSILRGGSRPWAYDRSISVGTIRRANTVVLLSIVSFIILSAFLLLCEPELSPRALLFEAVSALFTVGSSLGITSSLGFVSKVAVCLAMFVGRVGIISLLTGLIRPGKDISEHLPQENLIIN